MSMSEEMQKMINIVKKYDAALRKYDNKRYIAPDIPDKIMEKLIKRCDSHLAVNNVVAFYDSTLFGNAKEGVLFAGDGFYSYGFMEKPVYFNFKDIIDMHFSLKDDYLHLKLNSDDVSEYTLINGSLDKHTLKTVLEELIAISKSSGRDALKSTGKVKKMDLPPEITKKCNAIIHTAATSCGGVAAVSAQIPASDSAVIVPVQIGMIVGLGEVFELNITESAAKSIIASAGATLAGRTASQFLVGWIPFIGNAINTATAAGVTEAIGWIAVKNFYERWLEDRTKGRYEGMKDGYAEASWEYETKLKKQAQAFLNQIKDVKRERDEYEKLLDEYEVYIEELERRNSGANSIREMKEIYSNLKAIKSV